MQEALVNRLGCLSLPRKSVVRLTDRPDMTLDVYHGRETTIQQQQQQLFSYGLHGFPRIFINAESIVQQKWARTGDPG